MSNKTQLGKEKHCFNGKFFPKVIKGFFNALVHGWARSGCFFSHLPKELRVVQTKEHPIPLVQSVAFGGYICIRVPGIQRCRRRWVVFSWISRRTEPWVQDWIFFGCPKMDEVQRTFCEIFPHFLFFRMIVWRAEMNVYVVLIS